MVKSTWEWPCRSKSDARSDATSTSRRPAKRTARISSKAASAAAPAAAIRSSSDGSLTARSIGNASLSDTKRASGRARCRPSKCIAQADSLIAYVASERTDRHADQDVDERAPGLAADDRQFTRMAAQPLGDHVLGRRGVLGQRLDEPRRQHAAGAVHDVGHLLQQAGEAAGVAAEEREQ